MSTSYSYTETATFTVTHARHMAAKVATDLKRMQRFYGSPSDERIAQFEAEATELIRAGYLGHRYLWLPEGRQLDRTDAAIYREGPRRRLGQ